MKERHRATSSGTRSKGSRQVGTGKGGKNESALTPSVAFCTAETTLLTDTGTCFAFRLLVFHIWGDSRSLVEYVRYMKMTGKSKKKALNATKPRIPALFAPFRAQSNAMESATRTEYRI